MASKSVETFFCNFHTESSIMICGGWSGSGPANSLDQRCVIFAKSYIEKHEKKTFKIATAIESQSQLVNGVNHRITGKYDNMTIMVYFYEDFSGNMQYRGHRVLEEHPEETSTATDTTSTATFVDTEIRVEGYPGFSIRRPRVEVECDEVEPQGQFDWDLKTGNY